MRAVCLDVVGDELRIARCRNLHGHRHVWQRSAPTERVFDLAGLDALSAPAQLAVESMPIFQLAVRTPLHPMSGGEHAAAWWAKRIGDKVSCGLARPVQSVRCDAEIAAISQPVRIVFARGDKMISETSARRLARLFPDARLREYSEGGHHAIFLNERIRDEICGELTAGGTL